MTDLVPSSPKGIDRVRKAPHAECWRCPLRDNQMVTGDPIQQNVKFTIVAESPGQDEAIAAKRGQGRPLIGPSGKLLWALLAKLGVKRDECNVTNAVMCQPPSNYDEKQGVLSVAAECCSKRLHAELAQAPDARVLALGKTAREAFFGPEQKGESITTLHGRWIIWGPNRQLVLSTYHPAFILRDPDSAKTLFDDVQKFVTDEDPWIPTPPAFKVAKTIEDVIEWAKDATHIAFDLETDQIDFRFHDILLMVLYKGTDDVLVIPGAHREAPLDLLRASAHHLFWAAFWSNPNNTYIGHNAKFDVRFLRYRLLWQARCDFDTMLAHYVLDERKGTHDLKGLSARFLNVPDYENELHQYLKSRNDYYGKIPWRVLTVYAAWDAWCTFRLYEIFERQLDEDGQYYWPFQNIIMPLSEVLTQAELHGIMIDDVHLEKASAEFDKRLTEIASEIKTMSKGVVQNMNSPKQMTEFLYGAPAYLDASTNKMVDTGCLGLKAPSSRKIKEGSTSKEALEHLKGLHPAIALILEHRKIAKMRSSYVENLLNFADEDHIVRADFQIHGTETGRLSVRDPALQTIPRGSGKGAELGKIVKDAFVARKGRKLLQGDYSQAELRAAAALSGEPFLIDVYEHDRDLHSEVAIGMYGKAYTKEDRVRCKMFNFSYLYGGNEYSFAQDSGLDIEIAKKFVRDYDALMPRLAEWKKEQYDKMARQGYVQYRTGRRRRIPFISYANQDEARKAAVNSEDQGTASDLTCMSAIAASKMGMHVVLLVHDSVIVECPEDKVGQYAAALKRIMEEVAAGVFPEVKWKADVEYGDRWGSLGPVPEHMLLQGAVKELTK